MQVNFDNIKLILMLVLVVVLYAFTSNKNKRKVISTPKINFVGDTHLFITQDAVSKLLIQNYGGVKNVTKETLDLNLLENTLNTNDFIESAQVYLSVDGVLQASVKQKKPLARVLAEKAYYVANNGDYMPLSNNYSERVPFVTGEVNKKELATIYRVAKKINDDEFLKQNVVQIHQYNDKTIAFKLRKCNFNVYLGDLTYLDKKINNLKVFYKKAVKDKLLKKYKRVNLQFENQVVCTKF